MDAQPRKRAITSQAASCSRHDRIPVSRGVASIEPLERRMLLSGGYTAADLASFTPSTTNPSAPAGQLARDAAGDLFGIATAGGANGTGAIFEVLAGNTTPITVASFPAATGGAALNPSGLVMDSAGNLFGITQSGGNANGDGTVFEVVKGGDSIQTVAQFNGPTTGSTPGGNLVIDSAGDVVGLTSTGGPGGGGTVWVLPAGSTTIVALAAIPTVSIGGIAEQAGIGGIGIDSSGDVFGTTTGNAAQGVNGTIWELPAGAGVIQTLSTFAGGTFGATPVGAIAVSKSGNVYGVTSDGGSGSGTIWEQTSGLSVVTLAALGGTPAGGVAIDGNGNVFGITSNNDGGVFELHAQSVSVGLIQTFDGTDGSAPSGGLITDRFGDVYGTTTAGGAGGGGTVFVMDLGGASNSSAGLASKVLRTSLPASIVTGKAAHGAATVQISNPSKTTVRGVFTIDLFASPDGTVDSTAVKIGAHAESFNLPAGTSRTFQVTARPFTANVNGPYTVLAQLIDATGNSSAATGGPVISANAPFIALSETIPKVRIPPPLTSGQAVKKGLVTLKITNHGNVAAKGSITVELLASPDGSVASATRIAMLIQKISIAAAASASLNVPVTMIPSGLAGSFVIVAQVTDPEGHQSTASSSADIVVNPALASPQ